MEATPARIINYFSEFKQYLVPLFQRPYMWTAKGWRNLWDDLLTFYECEPRRRLNLRSASMDLCSSIYRVLVATRAASPTVTHLSGLVGAQVMITLDIEAIIPEGVPDNVVRIVTENGRALKFQSQAF